MMRESCKFSFQKTTGSALGRNLFCGALGMGTVVWRPPSGAMELLQQPIGPDAVLHAVTTFFK